MFWILTLQVRFERKESMSWMKLGFIAGADTEFYLGGGGGNFSLILPIYQKICSIRKKCIKHQFVIHTIILAFECSATLTGTKSDSL
jgi:riboflavin transporter FmnP